ncbi:hypothetical protein [Metallibacterium sp.]
MAPDYQVGSSIVELINGYWGSLVTAAGALPRVSCSIASTAATHARR